MGWVDVQVFEDALFYLEALNYIRGRNRSLNVCESLSKNQTPLIKYQR